MRHYIGFLFTRARGGVLLLLSLAAVWLEGGNRYFMAK
jgi:hypothetical protein